ncbi:hypothetical protein [Aegicerativicinus sediminis]|uniref:hypothetical protein n=1 Tax=Aegicerativicinus sediminis TaxID=2893202 RepID=UPI001E39113C|nr:hypothetical protein [Aegicerativicinus sediminis]
MLFRQKKHKRFNYVPRSLKDDSKEDHSIKEEWQSVRASHKRKAKSQSPLIVFMIILGMVIVLWMVLCNYEM